jgi:NADH-quinone oxidoreductase subunit G
MPRPETRDVTFSIDGREVTAPENAMLVDAAKFGDVEIPVFCYEPKLGQPVGACRMCLVEIEGIPKLQTACSTPVKDGMVVHTQTARVHDAQRAVVEFLLINHPLDCPVCDKGGECPLQDITYGWGPGTSRFIEPKRHFKKPLELSPLVAIDRERCILCYRCVRYSQEVSEDYQLVLLERGAHSYVGTFDGHPYVAPFSGNIVELCPVGALTSSAYRFRARPWDIEGAGSLCTLCPAQCNVEFTVRDDRVMRVLARDNPDVDDGWLCDKGRFGYQSIHVEERITQPLVREGTQLMPASWEKALSAAGGALKKAGAKAGALAGGETSNEEAFLLASLFRDGLGSGHLASRAGGELPLDVERALANPALSATVADLEFAHTVVLLECDPVDDAPILDLRIRKGVRRHSVRLAIASARPTALDPRADVVERIPPGGGAALLVSLADDDSDFASAITAAGEDIVIVYGERLFSGANRDVAAKALLNLAARLGLAERPGSGLLEIPSSTNGRGLREAGFAPGYGAGFATLAEPGRDAAAIATGLADADLSVLYLLHADPLRSLPDRGLWKTALGTAQTVIAHESVMTETVREYADVVFPAEAYAEKEGTLTHPDGRLQRLRTAIGRPQPAGPGSGVRPGWQVIADVAERAGHPLRIAAGPIASRRLFEAVPFYAGLTLDEIGGQGVRWQDRDAASSFEVPAWEPAPLKPPRAARAAKGSLRLGTYRSLWSSKEVDVSPALHFLRPQQVVELSPVDAQKLGIADGDRVEVGANGTRVRGAVRLRDAVPKGSVFLADGTPQEAANALTEPIVEIARVGGPEVRASAVPAQAEPAAVGAEMPPSAPLAIPPTGPSQSGHDG